TIDVYHHYDVRTCTLTRLGSKSKPLTRFEEAYRGALLILRVDACPGLSLRQSTFGRRLYNAMPMVFSEHVFVRTLTHNEVPEQGTCALCKKGKTLTFTATSITGEQRSFGEDCAARIRSARG